MPSLTRLTVAMVLGGLLLTGGCKDDRPPVDDQQEALKELIRQHLISDHAYRTVGGTVTGLKGSGVVLQNNGGDDLAIQANDAFTFARALSDGGVYSVTVLSSATNPSQTCTVSNGSGTVAGTNVNNVSLICADPVEAPTSVDEPKTPPAKMHKTRSQGGTFSKFMRLLRH